MPSLIKHLEPKEREQLLQDLNYLNLKEFRSFCNDHGIPYAIWVETESGGEKKTRDTDRKSVVLERLRHYLKTGRIKKATTFAADVVANRPPPKRFKATDRLYYGWYDKKNPAFLNALKKLSDGQFRNGAISRILAREFWTRGEAPTMEEFAKAWQKANEKGLGFHPEAAWLTDRARNEAGPNWKTKRTKIAKRALKKLAEIPAPSKDR